MIHQPLRRAVGWWNPQALEDVSPVGDWPSDEYEEVDRVSTPILEMLPSTGQNGRFRKALHC
jgi:hypothetical protein